MCTTLPKTHIAVMGMERIAPTFAEVDVLITMLARSAVGARLTGYNTWLTGPREAGHVDGPEEFHLVIVDNGRSEVLASEFPGCAALYSLRGLYEYLSGISPYWRSWIWLYLSRANWCGDFPVTWRL